MTILVIDTQTVKLGLSATYIDAVSINGGVIGAVDQLSNVAKVLRLINVVVIDRLIPCCLHPARVLVSSRWRATIRRTQLIILATDATVLRALQTDRRFCAVEFITRLETSRPACGAAGRRVSVAYWRSDRSQSPYHARLSPSDVGGQI